MSPSVWNKRKKANEAKCRASFGSNNRGSTGRPCETGRGNQQHQIHHNHHHHQGLFGRQLLTRGRAHFQPTAPPMNLVMSAALPAVTDFEGSQTNPECEPDYRDWGPPPRYQEAICEPSAPISCNTLPLSSDGQATEQQIITAPNNQQTLEPPHYEADGRSGSRIPTPTSLVEDNNSNGSNQTCSSSESSGQEKRKTGSKIIKGLERAAFFVIQLLD